MDSKSSAASEDQRHFHEDKNPDGNDTCEDEGDEDDEDELLQAIEEISAKVDEADPDADADGKNQD